MTAFSISPRGPFSLAAAAEFLSGFPPADRPDAAEGPELTLAFLRDDFSGAAAVTLRERDGEIAGEGDDAVRAQAARMLSLDLDGSGYPAVGERDPVIGALMAEHPGLRPVLYPSPYEAAAWAIISARIRGAQAVAVRRRLMDEHGEPAGGLPTFPPPQRLLELTEVRGLTGEKVVRLHAVAEAALEGVLDAEALRALDADEARERLRAIRGIGPFLAELVLLRGAGAPDVLPAAAPRIRAAVAAAYGMAEPPDDARLAEISDAWRPYRGWVCLLLRASE
ncbi:MAG: DNA-3-methyladenine glycosylase [Solirubrobacteraceae bacterium]|nr:DNA-3-methyladenine glycosylase [Solirubrobacteraceae bacterium]